MRANASADARAEREPNMCEAAELFQHTHVTKHSVLHEWVHGVGGSRLEVGGCKTLPR